MRKQTETQLKLLQKIRHQNHLQTSKKHPINKPNNPLHLLQHETTPKTCKNTTQQKSTSNKLQNTDNYIIGVIKNYALRQDYYQCMIEVCCGLDYNGGRSGGEWSLRNGIGREDGVNMSNMSRGRKKLIKAMISRQQSSNICIWVGKVYQIKSIKTVQMFDGALVNFVEVCELDQNDI